MDATDTARSPLDEHALQSVAGPPWQVRLYDAADSTNALAAADPVLHLVVVADHQRAGRGRLDRTWETPPGAALTFSAVVDPAVESEWWPLVPLVAGYAVARALGDLASLKWPNDVLIGDRKLCGVLVERVNTRPPLAVIGMGINVDQADHELPVPTATSLALAGQPIDRTELFGAVVRSLLSALGALRESPDTFLADYLQRSATLGRDVRVELPGDRVVHGRASGIDDHGRLVLQTREGSVSLSAGDVVHVRLGE